MKVTAWQIPLGLLQTRIMGAKISEWTQNEKSVFIAYKYILMRH